MFANAIKQTTAATGTGNLTLASVAGYPTIANAVPVGVSFPYTLLDSNGLFLEAGFGYLSDATTLVRARVTATFNGIVYTGAGASASNLTGTTTVICSPHASSVAEAPHTVDAFSSGVGRYIGSSGTTNQRATYTLGASMFYIPFQSDFGCVANSMAINITAGVGGATATLGIYACNHQGYPGKLLASTAAFDVSTTGWKKPALLANLSMSPGFYFVALACASGITVTAIDSPGYNTSAPNVLGFAGDSFTPNLFRFGGAQMPSDASAVVTTGANVNHPAILIGVI